MLMLRLSLMLVVFVDVMGQGLILPIISTLLVDPASGFLPVGMTGGTREVLYGLLLSVSYIFWFFGAAYISKLSDYIGRKKGMVICLLGALGGYVLTVIAIEVSNYYLLLLSRAISGFTAGNQPIAQAALVDISKTDKERTENMGKVVAASALGLVSGPLIAGLLSDKAVVGRYATLELPFTFAAILVFLTLSLAIFMLNPNSMFSYIIVVPVVVPFAIFYPTMLALFSESAGEDEQGWVMGITIALFTMGSGMISLAGGAMMDISPRLPFMAGIASFLVALFFIATLWPQADVRALDKVEA